MLMAAVSVLLLPGGVYFRGVGTIRGPWVLFLSCFYIAIGVGLLRQFQWARLATIAVAIVAIAFFGVSLLNGLLQLRLIFVLAYLLRFHVNVLVVWYLMRPEIRRTFLWPTENTSALYGLLKTEKNDEVSKTADK